ncbi:peptidoglycan editing factor PgeF [Methyloradius palustris]|uniref:Purine nucleoside phosphorylase n=1 Tax=Methyloradius palustris TaxID=2778876 RepID=A0A8D5G0S0_9PROT|nr:peptidoglycan editing factor PgeF [Methyloradius palustris]BCM25250.1 laccase domain protein [Methyloradius palustris]
MTTLNESNFIIPNWPAPANIKALQTTRTGGLSQSPYDSLNFGDHVGDDALTVARNRQLLNPFVPTEPLWLKQTHSTIAVNAALTSCLPEADAAYSKQKNVVCAVMTADCLPILLCDEAGTAVAAIHAGWKGLLYGVIESTINALDIEPRHLYAWFGPAIGPTAFEVGRDVYDGFLQLYTDSAQAFVQLNTKDKWLADIYQLARLRMINLGVTQIYGGDYCTHTDQERFFSFRRDGDTGRMATLIWFE